MNQIFLPSFNNIFDPGMETVEPNKIKIAYKARFNPICHGLCSYANAPRSVLSGTPCFLYVCPSYNRNYFHVQENAVESNYSIASIYTCCYNKDQVNKMYFDRDIFEHEGCCWSIGYLNGLPTTHTDNTKYVCFGTPCGEPFDSLLNCYFPHICGDRVRVLPCENYCFFLPTRSCWLWNCCELCGPKSGEPLCLMPLVCCLEEGSGKELVREIELARSSWESRREKGHNNQVGVELHEKFSSPLY